MNEPETSPFKGLLDESRPTWHEYFLDLCRVVASRSTCHRGPNGLGVGCVIVRDRHVLVSGYAGSPPGMPHCDEIGHELITKTHADGRTSQHCIRTIHAEANAVAQAAKLGISLAGSTAYTSYTPCYDCARLLVAAGVIGVVAHKQYHSSEEAKNLFRASGLSWMVWEE